MQRHVKWVGVVAMSMATMVVAVAPVQAAGPAEGEIAVSGRLVHPTFPCDLPLPGEPPCTGTLESGMATGTYAGRHNGTAWTVAVNTPLTMNFAYVDSLPPEPPCVEGLAAGTGAFSNTGNNQAFGSYHNATIPAAVVGVVGTFDFQWRRMGAVMLFAIEHFTLTLQVVGVGNVTVVDDADGEGAAVFALEVSMQTVPDCLAGVERSNVRATMTGALRMATAQ